MATGGRILLSAGCLGGSPVDWSVDSESACFVCECVLVRISLGLFVVSCARDCDCLFLCLCMCVFLCGGLVSGFF